MGDKPLSGLGEKIRSQRESKGLSLQDIADKTKVPLSILQALENGDDSHLPAPVFVKGFLRSYALEIGLMPGDLIGEYNAIYPVDDKPVAIPVTARKNLEDRSWLWLVIPVFILLLGAGVWAYLYLPGYLNSNQQTETSLTTNQVPGARESQATIQPSGPAVQDPSANVEVVAGGPAPTQPETMAPAASSSISEVPAAEPTTTAAPEDSSPGTPSEPGEPGQTAGNESQALTATVSAGSETDSPTQGHELTMKFSADTWVQIAVDDKEIQHGLFKSGTSKTWHADQGFSLRIGNAGGVDLVFDGKDLGSLGGDGQVVAVELPEKTTVSQ